jgi:hypothetical protein
VGGKAEILISTDLTRATDLLPLDLIAALVQGLQDSGRLSPLEIEVLRNLTGPQDLVYGKGDPVRTSRGILMGLPTSWVMLSLVHLFWIDEVRRTSSPGLERRLHRAVVAGDDALLCTTLKGAAHYRSIVQACGGSVSEGKHFESRGTGVVRGVFTEKLFDFALDRGRITGGSRNGSIPVKGLTSLALPREFFGTTPVRCNSSGLVQIAVLDCLSSPLTDQACRNYIKHRTPWLAEFAEKVLGLSPGVPLSLGGFRFSPRTPEGDRNALFVRNSGRSFAALARREVDPEWRTTSKWTEEEKLNSIKKGELWDLGHLWPLAHDVEGPLWKTQVRLPEGDFAVALTSEREVDITMGAFCQMKVFCERKSEIYEVRARALAKILRRLREEGSKLDLTVSIDELPELEKRVAWRKPLEGATERRPHWLADFSTHRQAAIRASCVLRAHVG